MGGGASGMGGVEQLLQATVMIGKAIAGISFPGMYRIYDFHSELAPPLKNHQFVFFGFPDSDDENEEGENDVTVPKEQYEHLFHVQVGEDVIYLDEPLCVNESNWTPLHTCCMSIQTIPAAMKLIEESVNRGGNLDIKTRHGPGTFNSGWTCLHIATAYGIETVVGRLVEAGANVNTVNSFGYAPLQEACHRGFVGIAKILLDGGANITYIPSAEEWAQSPFISSPPQSPLAESCRAGFLPIVELLLNAGADVNQSNFLGWTSLHEACFYNRLEIVKRLLISGADATLRTRSQALPYHFASHPGIREVIEELGGEGSVPTEHDQINMLEVLAEISSPQTRIQRISKSIHKYMMRSF
jgi:ankyrin repeat protein